jgi:hypothetical protein
MRKRSRSSAAREVTDTTLTELSRNNSSESSNPVTKKSRKTPKFSKVSIACDPCKQSKVRCDNDTPCSRCVKHKKVDQCVRQVPLALAGSMISSTSAQSLDLNSTLLNFDSPFDLSLCDANELELRILHLHQTPDRLVSYSPIFKLILEDFTELRSPMAIHDFIVQSAPTLYFILEVKCYFRWISRMLLI